MEDLFKKFVYTSVGLVSLTVEKLQGTVDKLVTEDKISMEEGKKIVDDLFKNTESKREEFEAKLKTIAEDILAKMNLATATQVAELQERLAAVEAKLGIVHEAQEETAAEPKKKAPKTVAVEG
jgi:polyhydroxyalkanoate synthesis regulator phasin